MNTIAIDCGASFIKGAYIQKGRIVKRLQKQAPKVHGKEDIFSPVQISALVQLVKEMILELAEGGSEIKLCIANEMHGFILAYEDGSPYTDYISWQKEYSAEETDGNIYLQLYKDILTEEDIRFTGMPLRAGLPSCNLYYLSCCGYLTQSVRTLYFYTLGDYLLRVLSGKKPVCHPSNAAATGLFDLRTNNWNCNLAPYDTVILPEIGTSEICFQMDSLKVHALPAIGDQQAALLGAGLTDTETISFNLGTGAQVSKIVKDPYCSLGYQIRPYFYGTYLKTIPHLPSGRAFNVFIRFFKDTLSAFQCELSEDKLWSVLLDAGEKSQNSLLQCDLSFFENPITDHVKGSISNIEEYSFTVGNLINAILSRMSDNFIWAADQIEPCIQDVEKLIFTGGIARKIKSIQDKIIAHYSPQTKIKIAEDETLLGLYTYGNGEQI